MQKKVSFIVPELDENGIGKVSKSVFRKIFKYGVDNITKVLLNNVNAYEEGFVADRNGTQVIEIGDSDDDNTIVIYVSGKYDGSLASEGDRIDLFFSYENDITVEEKVHSSFDGLANGSVKFKRIMNGDVIYDEDAENGMKVFIAGSASGSGEIYMSNGSTTFLIGSSDVGIITLIKGGTKYFDMSGVSEDMPGTIHIYFEEGDICNLMEVIVE